jgi:hypothetical protein
MSESRAETPNNKAWLSEMDRTYAELKAAAMTAGQFGPVSMTIQSKDGIVQEVWTDLRKHRQRPVVR